ncbi:MOSC domain-containing protein [Cupriavidus agavae]|uniref:MOSC domain-containing protein YiiM n=1 Tax=Cupriavidus agavae TaxID=1001822 RepID=A0A4Q7RWY8_9BURK|nr:MOSC domain-containing protein [Cupriavidus agavae]RZT38425.1 MOSC domain-containing protein YiiM [Cupriavidus agavae]
MAESDPRPSPMGAGGAAVGRVLAVNVGTALPLVVAGAGTEAVVMSAIRKHPLSTQHHPIAVGVHRLGMAGDEQVDRSVHGGPDRAVYAYPIEHYTWWNARRREAGVEESERPLAFGAMGENLTTQGLLETALWVDDRLCIGDVEFVVKSPRRPCYKFNAALGYAQAVRDMMRSGFSGVYLGVARPGVIRAGDSLVLQPGPRTVSLASLNRCENA